jgi:hypothetical protein
MPLDPTDLTKSNFQIHLGAYLFFFYKRQNIIRFISMKLLTL